MPQTTYGRFLSPVKLIRKRLADGEQSMVPLTGAPESGTIAALTSAHYDDAFIEEIAAAS